MLSLKPFIESIERQNICMDAVMVVQNDVVLGLHRFTDQVVHNVFSVAKSYTSAAIGFAVDDGFLKLTDKPYDMFQELLPESIDPRWKDVTLFHLLTMTSGHGEPHLMVVDRKILRGETEGDADQAMREEWLRFAFTRPMVCRPGEAWSYGNLAPYVAGRMLEKAAGCSMRDYLYEKMWKPLRVKKPRWDSDTAGHTFGASDLYLDITDMIKLGQIYLGMGELDGRRFLSREWVEWSTACHYPSFSINPFGYAADEECGYGFYFWHNTKNGSYRAYGREGQFVIVLPEQNAVIAIQSMHSDVQPILDAVWEHILPWL